MPERAAGIGAEVVQIFSSNPRMWEARWPQDAEILALTEGLTTRGLPLFLHTIYLINLASPDPDLRRRSAGAVAHALTLGALTEAAGVVTHVGSHRGAGVSTGLNNVVDAIHSAFANSRSALRDRGVAASLPTLLLETGVGAGTIMGARLEELAAILAPLTPAVGTGQAPATGAPEGRVGICLDSAHLFAAGYPVHDPVGLEEVLRQLQVLDLLPRVGLMHLNDSRDPFASNHDRHENPGNGHIGHTSLARMVTHPALAHIPFVLEVPGADGHGPDAESVAVVKAMRAPYPRRGPVRAAGCRAARE